MRTFHFGTIIANVDHVVKLEAVQVRDATWKLSISFSDGTFKDIFPSENIKVGELANKLAQRFKDPNATETYLNEVIAQLADE